MITPAALPKTDWSGVWTALVASLIWFVIGAIPTLTFVAWRKDRSRFHGRWKTNIKWRKSWAKKLMGPTAEQPHSEGEMSLSYGAGQKKNQYWGLASWVLKDGTKLKAEVCTEVRNVNLGQVSLSKRPPYIEFHRLRHASLYSRIRNPIPPFKYHSHVADYDLIFRRSTGDKLEAQVRMQSGSESPGKVVGSFSAERIT
jgi:hypothetical protein